METEAHDKGILDRFRVDKTRRIKRYWQDGGPDSGPTGRTRRTAGSILCYTVVKTEAHAFVVLRASGPEAASP
jgi:hypothetical protein